MKQKKIYIFGCSGIAKSIIDSIRRLKLDLMINIVDSNESLRGQIFYKSYPIQHLSDLELNETKDSYAIFAFFKPADIFSRKDFIENTIKEFQLLNKTIIDPLAKVSSSAIIDSGSYIAPGVVVDSDVNIGRNCIILFNSIVSREVQIASNVFISASTVIKGSVTIGSASFIGAGALITKNIMGLNLINAGSFINKQVEKGSIIGTKSEIVTIALPEDKIAAQKKLRFFHP